MPVCPQCGGEYREGVKKCSDCRVHLVAELESDPGRIHGDPGIELVDVWVCSGEAEAQIVRGFLEEQGIDCLLKGEAIRHVHGFSMTPLGKVRIQVRAEDHGQALSSIQGAHNAVECAHCGAFLDAGAVVCPQCKKARD